MAGLDYSPLLTLIRELRASNMSVLRATLDTPDSQIATVANSQNEVFWSALVEHGLARELPWDPDLESVRPHWRTFALTDAGRAALPMLLGKAASGDV
jgi:hypothetical protein